MIFWCIGVTWRLTVNSQRQVFTLTPKRENLRFPHFGCGLKSSQEVSFLLFCCRRQHKHLLGLTAQEMRWFFFCHTFLFSKKKSVYNSAIYTSGLRPEVYTATQAVRPGLQCILSFWFYGQAVRPGLFAFQAVRPEMHTAGRKACSISWSSP